MIAPLRRLAVALLLLAAPVALLTGCAGISGAEEKGQYTLIISEDVQLNEEGPMQSSVSTVRLPMGTRVRLVQNGGTFVKIETVSGKTGWVPSSAVTINQGL